MGPIAAAAIQSCDFACLVNVAELPSSGVVRRLEFDVASPGDPTGGSLAGTCMRLSQDRCFGVVSQRRLTCGNGEPRNSGQRSPEVGVEACLAK
jgi:hypothetical protein